MHLQNFLMDRVHSTPSAAKCHAINCTEGDCHDQNTTARAVTKEQPEYGSAKGGTGRQAGRQIKAVEKQHGQEEPHRMAGLHWKGSPKAARVAE